MYILYYFPFSLDVQLTRLRMKYAIDLDDALKVTQ